MENLAPEERKRAERFRFPMDRERFILARGALRGIIGRYLDVAPHLVRFSYNAYGKPMLDDGFTRSLRFNLAHSRYLALYALTEDREVGIDVEFMRADLTEDIADHYFSPLETARLKAMPPEERWRAFFRVWTCKEAYVKAKGVGLSMSLNRFVVSTDTGEPFRLKRENPTEPLRWSFTEILPAEGYVGAVAVQGVIQPVFWQWNF